MENNDIESMYEELLKIEEIFIKNNTPAELNKDNKEHLEKTPLYDEYYSSQVFDSLSNEFDENEEKTANPCWEGYVQKGMKKGKSGKMVPNCIPIESKTALKDPDGGLTAAGREFFKRTEGANLKPGVKGAADTPNKMRRKGSFLTRFFTNPSGPMVDEKGKATRLALSATAWGERVPKNAKDAAALAEKGRNLLERYKNSKEKSEESDDFETKAGGSALGTSIGQNAGGAAPSGTNPADAIDHDNDGMIFDGTSQEQRAQYERSKDNSYEKQRRKFVRAELARQGIKRNAKVQNRSSQERNARARARGAYDRILRDRDGKPVADGLPKGRSYPPGQKPPSSSDRSRKPADRYPDPPNADRGRKPADRYPDPPNADRGRKPADRYPDPPNADRGRKPADRYPDPQKPRGPKPADRYPNPSSDRSRKPADRNPNPPKKYPPGQKPSPKKPKAVNMPYPVTWERGEA